jgi:hypothetical protein
MVYLSLSLSSRTPSDVCIPDFALMRTNLSFFVIPSLQQRLGFGMKILQASRSQLVRLSAAYSDEDCEVQSTMFLQRKPLY